MIEVDAPDDSVDRFGVDRFGSAGIGNRRTTAEVPDEREGTPVTQTGDQETGRSTAGSGSEDSIDRRQSSSIWSVKQALAVLRETAVVVVIALVLSLVIKTFFIQAFFIPSGSMETTLLIDDRVLVSKLTPGPFDLHRGDIVVFADPSNWLGTQPEAERSGLGKGVRSTLTFVGLLPSDSDNHLIKRVIGLPGDRVECCDSTGRLMVNGTAIDEPYLYAGNAPSEDPFAVTIPEGRLWVMGDHRGASMDSRYHQELAQGTIPVDGVVGRAFVTVWPLNRGGLLRNPAATFAKVPDHPPALKPPVLEPSSVK